MLRQAAVKGYFYPETAEELGKFIAGHAQSGEKTNARAVVVPHAGYLYSGKTAVKTLSQVVIPKRVLLIGPNHTGFGDSVAVSPADAWETPLGNVPVSRELRDVLVQSGVATADTIAHVREHSLEVIVPILKYFNPDVEIAPITMMGMRFSECIALADLLVTALEQVSEVLIVISSDLNHYENAQVTQYKDKLAVECMLRTDSRCLYDAVMNHEISMCGVYPAVVGIEAARKMGAHKGLLVEHTHSGEVSGDHDQVVGYAGVILQ